MQAGGIEAKLLAEVFGRLPLGSRLLCCVDTVPDPFSLGLPHATFIRRDGWAGWEARC